VTNHSIPDELGGLQSLRCTGCSAFQPAISDAGTRISHVSEGGFSRVFNRLPGSFLLFAWTRIGYCSVLYPRSLPGGYRCGPGTQPSRVLRGVRRHFFRIFKQLPGSFLLFRFLPFCADQGFNWRQRFVVLRVGIAT
jgi:hypothetical protein